MRTFAEWVQDNHPEDEILNEMLGTLARSVANTSLGRAAILAGAMSLGPTSTASAVTPPTPAGFQQSSEKGYYSNIPFNKKLLVELAPKMGINQEKLAVMDEFGAWELMMKKLYLAEKKVSRSKAEGYPSWYIRIGYFYNPGAEMNVRAWRPPAPPKVEVTGTLGSIGGGQ